MNPDPKFFPCEGEWGEDSEGMIATLEEMGQPDWRERLAAWQARSSTGDELHQT